MIKANSMKSKISILLGSSIIGITIIIAILSFFVISFNLRSLLRDRAATIIQAIGPTLELGLYSENVIWLESPVRGLLDQKDIIYSSIYTLDGENLIQQSEINFDLVLSEDLLKRVKEKEFISYQMKLGEKVFLDCLGLIYPLESEGVKEPLGILRIGLSLGAISSAMKSLMLLLGVCLIVAILISVVITTYSLNKLLAPLYDLRDGLREISKGKTDLNARLSEKTLATETSELAFSFNRFVESLQKSNTRTREVAERMSAQAEELSASAEQMTASSEEVSSTMQQIAHSSDKQAAESQTASEMAQKALHVVRQSLDSAQDTLKSSENILNLSKKGEESAKEVRLAMDNVTNITNKLEEVIQQVQKRSEEILGIIETVGEISKKTNVLALNATIEASKAGESGRGFAVVAEEIRKLATQSAKSTRKISEILNEVSSVIDSVILKTEETIEEVTKGKDTSLKSADYLKNIADEIGYITKRIREITINNKQGEEEVHSITVAVENIVAIAEENAASSEEISAAVQQLSASIQQLSGTSEETAAIAEELYKLTKD
ncbi:HAMP domain-containing protein [candidate division WOR-3 bacterium]|nr:HAMP domain-containing protein [candidate division WOR-3 bacterium]